jgi:hypothetical protein
MIPVLPNYSTLKFRKQRRRVLFQGAPSFRFQGVAVVCFLE